MAYYGNNYYEREVIRDTPCDSYSEFSRVEGGYGRPGYPIGHHHNHHHNNNVVTDVVYESSTIPSYGHHHHHSGAEVIERKEERIVYENEFDPCRRMY